MNLRRPRGYSGEETILVDRPGFKPGGRRHALLGGFDSHSSPPLCIHSPAARPHLGPVLLAVRQYGCAARANLRPLATATGRKAPFFVKDRDVRPRI